MANARPSTATRPGRSSVAWLLGLLAVCHSAYAIPETTAPASTEVEEAFDIWEIQVEGNTLLPRIDVERAVYSHLGEKKSITDVTAAQQQLEELYHQRGFGSVLVDIPEQDVLGGVVRLTVTEAKIARTRVTGSRYFSLGRIKAKIPSLAAGQVPNLSKVQEELAALGQLSRDRAITPVLRPSRTPGKLDVELKVKDSLPLHGDIELNDRYSADTSHLRLNASLRYDNLWQREHSVGLSYQVAPQNPDEVEVYATNYLWRFEDSDNLLSAYAVVSNSNVATVGTLGVIGSGIISGLRYNIPLQTLGTFYHSLSLGGDYKDFDESIALQGNDAVVTPISYLMFVTSYNATHFGEKTVTHFDFGVNFGVNGLGNTQKEFEQKRFRAVPNFVYARFRADHEMPIGFGNTLFTKLEGQVADTPLISNEEFSAGGVDSVRGYLESEKQSDDAFAASLELRSLNLARASWDPIDNLRVFVFTDAATLHVQAPLPGSRANQLLWSTSIGARLTAFDHLQAQLLWAFPLKDGARTEAGDQRAHVSVGYEF
jgi:hemolysin activation/secretion protein